MPTQLSHKPSDRSAHRPLLSLSRSPSARSLAKGDYTGHLGRRFEHIGGDLAHKTLKGEVQSAPPNIKTNPSKKGSYGQPWTTLSERKGAKGVAGEYAYHTGAHSGAGRRDLPPRHAFHLADDSPRRA